MIEEKSHKKIAYVIAISRILDTSWEWLFLFFCAFTFAKLSNGGLLTALTLINCALTRTFFSKKIAILTENMKNRLRLSASIFCRIGFTTSFFLLPEASSNFYLLSLWTTIVTILFIFDEYLTFGLRYFFNDKKYISITRFNSILNLGRRGSVAISSIVAYMIGANNWYALSYAFILVGILAISISIITLSYFGNIPYQAIENNKITSEIKEPLVFSSIGHNESILFPMYLFLMNLFFSSGALLFSRALLKYKLLLFNSLNIITFFYSGFVIFNIFALFFDSFLDKLYKKKHLLDCYMLTIIMSCIIYLFRYHLILCLSSALLFGLLYGFTLSCFYSLATALIRGSEQNKLYATIDVSGRIGMVISQLFTGFLLDYQFDPLSLMGTYGLIALSAPVAFFLYRSQKMLRLRL